MVSSKYRKSLIAVMVVCSSSMVQATNAQSCMTESLLVDSCSDSDKVSTARRIDAHTVAYSVVNRSSKQKQNIRIAARTH